MLQVFQDGYFTGGQFSLSQEMVENTRRYSSYVEVERLGQLGAPLSLVFVYYGGQTLFGPVVVRTHTWVFIPMVVVSDYSSPDYNFDVFRFIFSDKENWLLLQNGSSELPEVLSYGFYLPQLPRVLGRTELVGSVVTTEMQYLRVNGTIA